MIVTYSLALVAVIAAICFFFSPAFAYEINVEINGQLFDNVTLFNIATELDYTGKVLPFEFNDLALILLINTALTAIVMGFCALFYAFYKTKTGLKIKRMIFADIVGFVFTIGDLVFVSTLTGQYIKEGKTIGLAFIFYFLAIISSIVLLCAEIIAIFLRIEEKNNWERFQELITIEESRINLLQDQYKKDLAIANVKYMKGCHRAPKVSKDTLSKLRESTLKMMLEAPCDCHHHHE